MIENAAMPARSTASSSPNAARAFIIIPAYNEGHGIAGLLGQLQRLSGDLPLSVILVNDGSTDDTLVEAARFQGVVDLEIINHSVNQGVPQTFYDGLAAAASRCENDDYIVIVEGDGTNDLQWVPRMSALIQEGADLVIASRFVPGGGYLNFPRHRTWGSRLVNYALRMLLRFPGVTDYTIFFRAYRAAVVKKALEEYAASLVSGRSFAANLEILLKVRPHVKKMREVPLVYNYAHKGGPSSMRVFRTLYEYGPLLLRWYLGRL